MGENALSEFRSVYKRIYLDKNYEKRVIICTQPRSNDEEYVWELCKRFWPIENAQRTTDIDQFKPNPNLSDKEIMENVKKLNEMLDKLGWARLPE